jgi:hypothetical protein
MSLADSQEPKSQRKVNISFYSLPILRNDKHILVTAATMDSLIDFSESSKALDLSRIRFQLM